MKTLKSPIAGGLALLMVTCAPTGDGGEPSPDMGDEPSTVTIFFPRRSEYSIVPAWNQEPSWLLFPPLMINDERGELVGNFAKGYEVSEDGRTWTYHLRDNARWHDGEPFTAHDIAFSYELWSHPDVLAIAPEAVTTRVHDDSTITITFSGPARLWFANHWVRFLPRHLLAHLEPAELVHNWDQFFWPPVGYGPYRYARHVPSTMVELEANPDWIRGRPEVDRVRIRFGGVPDMEFEAGNIDVAEGLNATDALRLGGQPGLDYCIQPAWSSSALYWNHRRPAFSDVRVRRALTLAIDRQELADVRGFPPDLAMPDVRLTRRQRAAFRIDARAEDWEWPDDVPQPIPHDPEAAVTLLAQAGWVDADGDGVREKENIELRFDLLTTAAGQAVAGLLQDQLQRVGARVEILSVPRSDGRQRFETGEFDAALGGVGGSGIAPTVPGGGFMKTLVGEPLGSPERPVGYFNPRLDSLVAVDVGWSDALREEIGREIQSILREDAVLTFLVPELRVTVFRDWIRGLGDRCSSWQVEDWWIGEDGGEEEGKAEAR